MARTPQEPPTQLTDPRTLARQFLEAIAEGDQDKRARHIVMFIEAVQTEALQVAMGEVGGDKLDTIERIRAHLPANTRARRREDTPPPQSLVFGYAIEDTQPKTYDPAFGDDKLCRCGHPYYRHFDSYDRMAPVGCKYCSRIECPEFKP